MSQARIYETKKARKEWTCGNCKKTIKKGEGVLHFTVGYGGFEQHRCTEPACRPTRADLESTLVSSVYDAIDSADFDSAETLDDLKAVVQEVIDAIEEVAGEYESNEMFEINEDLQERVDILRSAADELESWDSSLTSEPEEEDYQDRDEDSDEAGFEEDYADWIEEARDAARSAVEDVELP